MNGGRIIRMTRYLVHVVGSGFRIRADAGVSVSEVVRAVRSRLGATGVGKPVAPEATRLMLGEFGVLKCLTVVGAFALPPAEMAVAGVPGPVSNERLGAVGFGRRR